MRVDLPGRRGLPRRDLTSRYGTDFPDVARAAVFPARFGFTAPAPAPGVAFEAAPPFLRGAGTVASPDAVPASGVLPAPGVTTGSGVTARPGGRRDEPQRLPHVHQQGVVVLKHGQPLLQRGDLRGDRSCSLTLRSRSPAT
ncbi:hypothetical protein GCM10023238_39620 [Streptomyces heliomycini]